MKVLITGGAGFLGSHLSDALLERGDEVTILDIAPDRKVRHNLGHPRFRYVQGSVLDAETVRGPVEWCDLIYHFAAVVGVEHYMGDPHRVLTVNINGTQIVLNFAVKYRKKVIFSSSSEVYGRSPEIPFEEDGPRVLGSSRVDRWCYATSKAAGEHFCFALLKMGLPVVILRFFNVYGPRLDTLNRGRVIPIFMGQLLRGEPLTVIGDGCQTRCFTYLDDAIHATLAAGLKEEAVGAIINVGSDKETTIRELAELMLKVSGSRSTIKYVTPDSVYGPRYEDLPRRVPAVRRMKELLRVEAQVPLEEGLEKTIAWFRGEYW